MRTNRTIRMMALAAMLAPSAAFAVSLPTGKYQGSFEQFGLQGEWQNGGPSRVEIEKTPAGYLITTESSERTQHFDLSNRFSRRSDDSTEFYIATSESESQNCVCTQSSGGVDCSFGATGHLGSWSMHLNGDGLNVIEWQNESWKILRLKKM